MELYFFLMNFGEGALILFLDDLEVKKCTHAQSFPICINKDDKNF